MKYIRTIHVVKITAEDIESAEAPPDRERPSRPRSRKQHDAREFLMARAERLADAIDKIYLAGDPEMALIEFIELKRTVAALMNEAIAHHARHSTQGDTAIETLRSMPFVIALLEITGIQ